MNPVSFDHALVALSARCHPRQTGRLQALQSRASRPALVLIALLLTALLLAAATSAQAVSISQMSPQGDVAQVRQISLRFSAPVVPMGDLRQPEPVSVACQPATPAGSGRWLDAQQWVFDFRQPLPPGHRCTVAVKPSWVPVAMGGVGAAAGSANSVTNATAAASAGAAQGGAITGSTRFSFATGGPAVAAIQPYEGSDVAEDQAFILQLNGPATADSLARHAWCEIDGVAERLPLRLLTGAPRDALLKDRRLQGQAANTLVVDCGRPLPPEAKLRLVWGKGMAAAANPALATRRDQRFDFQVRKAFSAEFSCERERANAPCIPVRPMVLRFSEPVPRELALLVRLKPASGPAAAAGLAPVLDPGNRETELSELRFATPQPERTAFAIHLPAGLKDVHGRPLANAGSFPLQVATGDAPPIAKLAAAPFGVVESGPDAMLPLTLRHVQPDLAPAGAAGGSASAPAASGKPPGQVRVRRIDSDTDVLAWYRRVAKYHETQLTAKEAGLPKAQWTETQTDTDERGKRITRQVERYVGTRELSLLAKDPAAKRLDLPQLAGGAPRPFEVVGIPLPTPGYHVVEIESARLGQALLDKRAPMYVRSGVLVTNLGVHFKWGRENSAVWVTTLDRGKPVAAAEVAVYDCSGQRLWQGRTDAQGLAMVAQPLQARPLKPVSARMPASSPSVDEERPAADCEGIDALFVTARHGPPGAAPDMAFVFSDWQQGIEPWRFNLPTSTSATPDVRAHTVFDRTLLRAGELVAMKHFIRQDSSAGLAALPEALRPSRVKIVHEGSGDEFTQPITWTAQGRSAVSSWRIPATARLGLYQVLLERPDAPAQRRASWPGGQFRVEEFRVPLVDARLTPPAGVLVAPRELPLGVQLNYLAGGAVAGAALQGSALLRPREISMPGYEDHRFDPPVDPNTRPEETDSADENTPTSQGRLVADKLALTTDAQGAARLLIANLPKLDRPAELLAEVSFNDPNGERQTVASMLRLWPSALVLGIRTGQWARGGAPVSWQAVALDTAGKPRAGQALQVRGRQLATVSSRKRLVGGFYAYDNRTEVKDLGVLCSGQTDAQGRLACSATLAATGEVELIVSGQDSTGHAAQAAASLWLSGADGLWFAQDNDDRIDVLPDKRQYQPGETARLQVRMPFRQATALLAVEREGLLQTRVVQLSGDDPTIELPIAADWSPNVYVSVLALRGRIRDVPWYSLFTWGWRSPVEWARAFWLEGKQYQAPTALVDLAKPSFKLGVAQLGVGAARHALQVSVVPEQAQYATRQTAKVRVKVTQGGQPVAGAELAFAAVDEGLLALQPNGSWQLLDAMLKPRPWGVATSTAQGQIIGRRHYGRKAVAAGGGGGAGATRELFDTLLLWRPQVALDAQGEAVIEVPLNDSLTSFRLVAVADAGLQQFGTGQASIRVSQDLQLLAGLPPLVRQGDRFTALLTVRNTTAQAMTVRATLQGQPMGQVVAAGSVAGAGLGPAAATAASGGAASGPTKAPDLQASGQAITLAPQDLQLHAGAARELQWTVDVPASTVASAIRWQAAVHPQGGAAADKLQFTQRVAAAVPVQVWQATLAQLDGSLSLPVAAPAGALAGQGGLQLALQPTLGGALPGVRRFFETYPYSCLEQQASRALALKDAAAWDNLAAALPGYLDADGLASYFPPRPGDAAQGSDRLSAYLLAAAHEAGVAIPEATRNRLLDGLAAFVDGRLQRRFWSPRPDMDLRRLAALEALARHGRAQPRQLATLRGQPEAWPTAALIDWVSLLKRLPALPDGARQLAQAQQILRARLTASGSQLVLSADDGNTAWWLMDSADGNANRLVLALLDDAAWQADLPRLVQGALARQQRGAWATTTANLWGTLALDKFSAKFETAQVTGRSQATLAGAAAALDWAVQPGGGLLPLLAWPGQGQAGQPGQAGQAGLTARPVQPGQPGQSGQPSQPVPSPSAPAQAAVARAAPSPTSNLMVTHQGSGKPWLSVQSLAAVPLMAPVSAGYTLSRSISPVSQKVAGRWSRGDVLRVQVSIQANADASWVVVSDPVPTGATLLGSGLGRDSAMATQGEVQRGSADIAFDERGTEAFRRYYQLMPRGQHVLSYSLRLNNSGRFSLPPTRVEAMYAPEQFGELPNAVIEVAP